MAKVLCNSGQATNSGDEENKVKKYSFGQDSFLSSGEFALDTWPNLESLRGLSSCRAVKLPDKDGNNLSDRIAAFMKRKAKAAPQTNRETLLEASVADEDRYCRIPFLDILNVIISFAVEKKKLRDSQMPPELPENTTSEKSSANCEAPESPFNTTSSTIPGTTLDSSFKDSLHQRIPSQKPIYLEADSPAENVPESLSSGEDSNSLKSSNDRRWSANGGKESSTPVKNRLSVPVNAFKRGSGDSSDSFELSPVLKVNPKFDPSGHSRKSSGSRMRRLSKSPGKSSPFVDSPAIRLKSSAKFDSPDRGNISDYVLGRIPYRFGRMLLAWCQKGMNPEGISNALYGCSQSKKMQFKGVSIVAWDEDTCLPPGSVLKFETQAEAERVARDLAKFRTHVQILSMDELMKVVVNMEVSHPPIRSSTLVVRSRSKQTSDPDIQEFESCLNKYGDVRSVQYLRRTSGQDLVCEVQYNCVAHGLLAVVALDDSYFSSIGGLRVQFKKSGRNEILVPKIAKFVQNCLKNK